MNKIKVKGLIWILNEVRGCNLYSNKIYMKSHKSMRNTYKKKSGKIMK